MLRAIVVALVLLLGACSAQPVDPASEEPTGGTSAAEPTPATSSPASSAAAEWREPTTYSFTLESQCGERNLIGRCHIAVENGVVVGVVGLDDPGRRFVAGSIGEVPTLADLLGRVAEARSDGADEVSMSTDPADGHPVSVEIDWQTSVTDDEECYTISDFAQGA